MRDTAQLLGLPDIAEASPAFEKLQWVATLAHQFALARQQLEGPEWFDRVLKAGPKGRGEVLRERLPDIEVLPVIDQLSQWETPAAREQFTATIEGLRARVAASEEMLAGAVAAVEGSTDLTDEDLAVWADLTEAMNRLVDVDLDAVVREKAPRLRGRSEEARKRRAAKAKEKTDE